MEDRENPNNEKRQEKNPEQTDSLLPDLPLSQQPLVYAKLSNNAYYPDQDIDLPKGYKVFADCPSKYQWWGYFGKSYYKIDPVNKTINFVIAHRGTDNNYGIFEDAELWLAEILPAQYQEGALPFMSETIFQFQNFINKPELAGYTVQYEVTGHSLGASLTELTMIDAAKGNLPHDMKAAQIENPGVPYEDQPATAVYKLPPKPKEDSPVADFMRKFTVLINTVPDAINTLYQSYSNFKYRLDIDTAKYPRFLDLPLPFVPSLIYYAYPYSFNVAHPDANVVAYLEANGSAGLKNQGQWPYELLNGFDQYKNYGLNAQYWDGYLNQLWNNNGAESTILQCLFDSYEDFSNFYIVHFLNVHALSKEESIQRQERGISQLKILVSGLEWRGFSPTQQSQFENEEALFGKNVTNFLNKLTTPTPKEYPFINENIDKIKNQIRLSIQERKKEREKFEEKKRNENDEVIKAGLEMPPPSTANQNRIQVLIDLYKELVKVKAAAKAGHPHADIPDEAEFIIDKLNQITAKYQTTTDKVFSTGMPESIRARYQALQKENAANPVLESKKEQAPIIAGVTIDYQAEKYKITLLRCISDILTNNRKLPKNSDKYIQLEQLRDNVCLSKKNYDIEAVKYSIDILRSIVSVHRDTHGIKGLFNLFFHRRPTSLTMFNKYFDQNNEIIQKKKPGTLKSTARI